MSYQQWYYLDHRNEQQGPFTSEKLMSLVEDSSIERQTLVWTESLGEWSPASKVGGLFSDKLPEVKRVPINQKASGPLERAAGIPGPKPASNSFAQTHDDTEGQISQDKPSGFIKTSPLTSKNATLKRSTIESGIKPKGATPPDSSEPANPQALATPATSNNSTTEKVAEDTPMVEASKVTPALNVPSKLNTAPAGTLPTLSTPSQTTNTAPTTSEEATAATTTPALTEEGAKKGKKGLALTLFLIGLIGAGACAYLLYDESVKSKKPIMDTVNDQLPISAGAGAGILLFIAGLIMLCIPKKK